MADGHLGYVMPIGGVAAYRDQVSVVGVGFDIACGNAAIRTNRRLPEYTRADLEHLADEIQRTISFGMGRTNRADDAPTDHPLFEHPAWDALPGKHEREGSGWRPRWWRSWGVRSWSSCTTITTSPGRRGTTARTTSWSERARRPRSRGKRGSWGARWVTTL